MSEERPADPSLDSLERLVAQCLERLETEGEEAIESVCREHPEYAEELRNQIRALHEMGLLEFGRPGEETAFPERLGDFRLIRRLGGGGMGVVYMAMQESLGREVAIKLIRPEHLFFPGARSRFRREVESAARLKHPGIVPVYMVGEEGGVPYFVMERIEGLSLNQVLQAHKGKVPARLVGRDLIRVLKPADTPEADVAQAAARLRIFASGWVEACLAIVQQVAEALDHAHRHGILHRDVKPSNIMLTVEGRAMLFDFGLARPEGASRMTLTGSQIGSVPYMSPEQVRGEHRTLDRRSDVYSLGITLYELLTLRSPFEAASTEEVRRRILEARPAPLRTLNPAASWEVETVCLKAMEPDPARRYATAGDLAQDITNILEHRPILARRPGLLLRLRRWSQRHPAAAVMLLAGLLLLGGAVQYGWQQRASRLAILAEKHRAEIQRDLSREVSDFMVDLFKLSDPFESRGKVVTAREILARGEEKIRTRLKDQPLVQAQLMTTIGGAYKNLGLYDRAEDLLREALAIQRRALSPNNEELAHTLNNLGGFLHGRHNTPEAEPLYLEALGIFRRLYPQGSRDVAVSLRNLGELYLDQGDPRSAEPYLRESLAMRKRLFGEEHPEVAQVLHLVARLASMKGDVEAADRLYRETLRLFERLGISRDMELALCLNRYGMFLQGQRKYEAAERMILRSLEMRKALFDEVHPRILSTLADLLALYLAQGNYPAAEPVARELLSLRRKALPEKDRLIAKGALELGTCLLELGRFDEAEPLLLEGYETYRSAAGADHPGTCRAASLLIRLYESWGKPDKAAAYRTPSGKSKD